MKTQRFYVWEIDHDGDHIVAEDKVSFEEDCYYDPGDVLNEPNIRDSASVSFYRYNDQAQPMVLIRRPDRFHDERWWTPTPASMQRLANLLFGRYWPVSRGKLDIVAVWATDDQPYKSGVYEIGTRLFFRKVYGGL